MTDAQWEGFPDRASARRSAARSLHPDVGGDGENLVAALTAIDRRFGARPGVAPTEPIDIFIRHSRGASTRARLRAAGMLYRRTRGQLPLGHRRYSSL